MIDADIATVSGAADKVLRVESAPPYLLHLEFAAGHDGAALPGKLLARNSLLADRHDLPVRSGVVLLHPPADSPRLTGRHERALPGEDPYVTFRYDVVRVWRQPPERFLTGGLSLLPLAPISAVTEAELPGIIAKMSQRLRRRRRMAAVLWSATYVLMGLRYEPALSKLLLQGVTAMKESSTYRAILEEGMAEGISLGRAEGAVAEARKMLLTFGEGKFGAADEEALAAVQGITDLERLEELARSLHGATSWQELLDPSSTKRRGRRRPS